MFLQRITDLVLRSRYHAMLAAFLCDAPVILSVPANSLIYSFISLVVSTFGIAIVGLVTLRRGPLEGFLALVAATLPYLLGYLFYPDDYTDQVVLVGALLVQISNVLTWVAAIVLYRTSSWSVTLEVIGVICIAGTLLAHVLFGDMHTWWVTQLNSSVKTALQSTGMDASAITGGGAAADLGTTLEQMSLFATRFAVGFVWVNIIVQLMISRWWQEKIFNPGELRKELHHIRLSKTAGTLFVLGLVLSFFQNQAVSDVMIVFYLTFGFAGFSLVHDIAASLKSGGGLLLIVVYTVLPISLILIPMLGLLDVWMDFRKRFHIVNSNFRKS